MQEKIYCKHKHPSQHSGFTVISPALKYQSVTMITPFRAETCKQKSDKVRKFISNLSITLRFRWIMKKKPVLNFQSAIMITFFITLKELKSVALYFKEFQDVIAQTCELKEVSHSPS